MGFGGDGYKISIYMADDKTGKRDSRERSSELCRSPSTVTSLLSGSPNLSHAADFKPKNPFLDGFDGHSKK